MTLSSSHTELKRRFFNVDVDRAEEKRASKRKRDNKLNKKKDKKKRQLEKCGDICRVIPVSPIADIEKHLLAENYGAICYIQGNNISDVCRTNVKPRFHLKALEHLLSKNIFDDDGVDKVKGLSTS